MKDLAIKRLPPRASGFLYQPAMSVFHQEALEADEPGRSLGIVLFLSHFLEAGLEGVVLGTALFGSTVLKQAEETALFLVARTA